MSSERITRTQRVRDYFGDVTGIGYGYNLPTSVGNVFAHFLNPIKVQYDNALINQRINQGTSTQPLTLREKRFHAGLSVADSFTNLAAIGVSILVTPLAGIAIKAAEIAISRRIGRRAAARASRTA